jgi:hypothetical protein
MSPFAADQEYPMPTTALLTLYEAIENASADMLEAARVGNWDQVVKLEGACVLLISQLKHAASEQPLVGDEAQLKSRIMQRRRDRVDNGRASAGARHAPQDPVRGGPGAP